MSPCKIVCSYKSVLVQFCLRANFTPTPKKNYTTSTYEKPKKIENSPVTPELFIKILSKKEFCSQSKNNRLYGK